MPSATRDGNGMNMKKLLNSFVIGGLGVFSAVFLFNPGLGIFLEIPDNIPIIGNLDEAAATAILISCLAYFGFDAGRFFGRKSPEAAQTSKQTQENKAVEAEIINR